MQTSSLIRKGLPVIVVVLFVGISTAVMAEQSNIICTKTNTILGLHESSRDQIELKYYDPNTLSSVVGVSCPMPVYWKEAIRLTQTELASYSTWNLTQVVIGFGEDPWEGRMNVTIIIYDTGTSTHPGPIIVDDTKAVLNGTALITVPLNTTVALAGHTELWVAVEWVQKVEMTHYAFVDAGPAVVGKGDWIYLNNVWEEIHSSIDSNWALGAIIEGPNLATIALGNIKGPLGITAELQNTGNLNAYNITWSIAVKGGILGRVTKSATGSDSILSAYETLSISVPPFLGFGKISIEISAQATNAMEVSVTKSAFLIGLYVIGIR